MKVDLKILVFISILVSAFGYHAGQFTFGLEIVPEIDSAVAKIRECREGVYDAQSAVAWAKYENEKLRGLKPGRPKQPQRQYEGHNL